MYGQDNIQGQAVNGSINNDENNANDLVIEDITNLQEDQIVAVGEPMIAYSDIASNSETGRKQQVGEQIFDQDVVSR